MTCEKIMKEKRREIINDSMQALHALAKLMPAAPRLIFQNELLRLAHAPRATVSVQRRAARGLCRRRDVSRL